jgi:hypothetical protein
VKKEIIKTEVSSNGKRTKISLLEDSEERFFLVVQQAENRGTIETKFYNWYEAKEFYETCLQDINGNEMKNQLPPAWEKIKEHLEKLEIVAYEENSVKWISDILWDEWKVFSINPDDEILLSRWRLVRIYLLSSVSKWNSLSASVSSVVPQVCQKILNDLASVNKLISDPFLDCFNNQIGKGLAWKVILRKIDMISVKSRVSRRKRGEAPIMGVSRKRTKILMRNLENNKTKEELES